MRLLIFSWQQKKVFWSRKIIALEQTSRNAACRASSTTSPQLCKIIWQEPAIACSWGPTGAAGLNSYASISDNTWLADIMSTTTESDPYCKTGNFPEEVLAFLFVIKFCRNIFLRFLLLVNRQSMGQRYIRVFHFCNQLKVLENANIRKTQKFLFYSAMYST